jgi:hypothetical protein
MPALLVSLTKDYIQQVGSLTVGRKGLSVSALIARQPRKTEYYGK